MTQGNSNKMQSRILIVDDVKGWRDYHSYIMNELFENANIQTAESARDGYDKLMENKRAEKIEAQN